MFPTVLCFFNILKIDDFPQNIPLHIQMFAFVTPFPKPSVLLTRTTKRHGNMRKSVARLRSNVVNYIHVLLNMCEN